MPSVLLISQSGGAGLTSGNILSGTGLPVGGIQLLLDSAAPGPVYVGLPWFSGGIALCSGKSVTVTSGQSSETSGMAGLMDGMRMNAGGTYFVPKLRLTSGIETIRIGVPAASSGGRMYFEPE